MKETLAQSATQCLEVDHRHLDAILLESEKAASAGSFADARMRFEAFASGLLRHIEVEEQVLFPELESAAPGARRPTSVMRAEHEELRGLLDRIGAELEARRPGWQAYSSRLKETLLTHNTKEERVLYPMADASLDGIVADRIRVALSQARGG